MGRKKKIGDEHEPLIRRLYCDEGRSIRDVAGVYEVSTSTLCVFMAAHDIPRRYSPTSAGGNASVGHLAAYNTTRARDAGAVQAARAARALRILGPRARPADADAGRLRVAYPADSLAGLAARSGVNKDILAGRLRRLLAAAGEEPSP